jgi:crotonobetainyl-CoA:carnitine CoA-transferase CaiB-like acyl-CoA transferase
VLSAIPTVSALDGIRVLDFSHALSGPYCTMLLSDYGACVYKLEASEGDMSRGWGPPFAGGVASVFLGLNRGKRGISIDLKQPEGLDLCLRLIDKVDVLVENFRPGTMDRLGLGYEAAHQRNPRLIYCSISGYGQAGPSRDEAAMDLVVQSSSGLLSITGTDQGESVRCGYGVTDVTAGLFAVIGILLALRARERTGSGQFVDVSMLDSMISTMSSNYMSFLGSDVVPRPMGSSFPTVVPYRVFQTGDRPLAIAVGSEKLGRLFAGRWTGRMSKNTATMRRTPRESRTATIWKRCWPVFFCNGPGRNGLPCLSPPVSPVRWSATFVRWWRIRSARFGKCSRLSIIRLRAGIG